MHSRREIENILFADVEGATKRHQDAKDDLIAISKAFHREPVGSDEDDPQVRGAESTLRNARLALLLALQKYNSFVSRGVIPEKLRGKTGEAPVAIEPGQTNVSALAGE
jgi:hypothetical protein